MSRSTRVGVVLPETEYGEEEWRNADAALAYVDRAAAEGAQLIVFPEGYPGPMTGPLRSTRLSYRPIDALRAKAREHRVYIAAGDVEENPAIGGTYFLTLKLISPEGEVLARYVRVQPDVPPLNAYLYNGRAHLLPGDDLVVVETSIGNIGLLICAEMYVPELCRILMLRGADILLAPSHGRHSRTHIARSGDTKRCVARARAAENLYYVVGTQNVYRVPGADAMGAGGARAFVAGPETMVASRDEPGVLMADLDMERLAYLRGTLYDENNLSEPEAGSVPIACRPGQIWERRPELYGELARPHRYSMDYRYFDERLDGWVEEYKRIYGESYREIRQRYGEPREAGR